MSRHYTTSSFCVACRLRLAICICDQAPRLALSTRLILIPHSKEWGTATNTGHFTRLALANLEVRLQGCPRLALSTAGIDAHSPSTLVLFPGHGADLLSSELAASLGRPATLLVPDGNWNQAKNMMRRVPMLRHARPVRLDGPHLDLGNSRRNLIAHRSSTFEAVARALGILEGADTERRLLDFFREILMRKRQSEF